MKSVACIGQGFVGGSLTTVFAERGFDVYAEHGAPRALDAVEDGEADLSIVEGVLKELAEAGGPDRIAVVKSTVPPGSTERLN